MILPVFALLTLSERIRLTPDMVLNESAVGDPSVRVYRFDGRKAKAYAVWCTTREDKRIAGYGLPVGPGTRQQVSLASGQPAGVSKSLSSSGSSVTLDVSEMPTFVLVQ